MNETTERNSITHAKHRKETWWQISFPFILGLLLILGLAGWAVFATATGGNVGQSADTSLIWIICPNLLLALIPLALFGGMAYGIIVLNQKIPAAFKQLQDVMLKVRDGVQAGADKVVDPVINLKSKIASLEALKRKK
jgi:hypothetical protein